VENGGNGMQQYQENIAQFEEVFDFASESDRAKIRGFDRDQSV
jgi:hypothetical protein